MEVNKLTNQEIESKIKALDGWEIKDLKLHKLFKFKNFNQALSFMVGVGLNCEKINHHPEWSNVYGNVDVKLTTHRVAGITELDFKLAQIMDKITGEINLRKD